MRARLKLSFDKNEKSNPVRGLIISEFDRLMKTRDTTFVYVLFIS